MGVLSSGDAGADGGAGGGGAAGDTGSGLIARFAGGLVVSCQAYPGEPLRRDGVMPLMALAAVAGGARAIRVQGVADIAGTAAVVDVPVIGLIKDGDSGVLITPTLEHALAVADAGADVVALDGTMRPRPDGRSFAETLDGLRARQDVLVMADCDSLQAAVEAHRAGADLIGTTLAGYTDARPATDGPDLELVAQIVAALPGVPVVAEGRIHRPEQAAAALAAGAHSVVVGTAITHPTSITGWFADALARPGSDR